MASFYSRVFLKTVSVCVHTVLDLHFSGSHVSVNAAVCVGELHLYHSYRFEWFADLI